MNLKERLNQVEKFVKGSCHEAIVNSEIDKQKPEIAFAISLKSKEVSSDWKKVQNNLALTLRSLLKNTDRNFRIIIAGHEKPNIEELNDERVTWLSVKFPPPSNSKKATNDKLHKRKVIGAFLRKSGFSGYFMPLDADDWIHFRFVEYIRSLPISKAFILNKGFMVNVSQNEVWIQDQFYKYCGSCALFYFSNGDFPKTTKKSDINKTAFKWVTKNHVKVPQYVKNHTMVDYPFVTYVLAHGENLSVIQGKRDNRISAEHHNGVGEKLEDWYYEYFKI
ncbi:hypothetical protein BGM26_13335 [Bacillus sp. FJAT-29790]|uniref:hypothetical protein n=1 Tax=Bacillus sp. FJAT-29790 TaxID=1895002 RepID=UPI001C24394C|nr:hypothetical protein [Bacillus sp. FJAT-29790]MBU8879962.1 hypothetical protein [Bacillus sp. FJAT-29790]